MPSLARTSPRSGEFPEAEWRLRVDLAACYRLVARFNMDDLIYTHISAHIPGTEHFLISEFGTLFSQVTASSLIKIAFDGSVVEPKGARVNVGGFVIHSAIHMGRPDAVCVLHTHTPAGMAVAALKRGLLPINQKCLMFHNRLAYHDYEGVSSDLEERQRLISDLGSHKAMILRGHGLLTCGVDCAEAFSWMYALERCCQTMIQALSTGQELALISPEIAEKTAQSFEQMVYAAPGAAELEWPALLKLLDPSYRD
jgi:ribulose-5-phosphate 4-epimerase/fuculose-1-phosphate aldolase